MGAFEDFRNRRVHDVVWLPALAGLFMGLVYNLDVPYVMVILLKAGIIMVLLAVEMRVFKMRLGQADIICILLIGSSPYFESLLFTGAFATLVILGHLFYLKTRKRALKNLPFVGYLGSGFVCYVALLFTVLF
jgi:hypothetical protein